MEYSNDQKTALEAFSEYLDSEEQWRDVYHLLTKPFVSVVGFNYNGKGMYSSVVPQSSGGNEDELLKAFCDRLLQ